MGDERQDFEALSRDAAEERHGEAAMDVWFEAVDKRLSELDRRLAHIEHQAQQAPTADPFAGEEFRVLELRLHLAGRLLSMAAGDPHLEIVQRVLALGGVSTIPVR